MRRPPTPALACALLLALRATAAVPPELDRALRRMAMDQDRWAFDWSCVNYRAPGRSDGETRIRHDPSLSFPEQREPLEVEGHAPREGDRERYRKEGERRSHQMAESRGPEEPGGSYPEHMHIGFNLADQNAVAFYERARVVAEDSRRITYEVPLRADRSGLIDVWSHFVMVVRLDRQRCDFEQISLELRRRLWFAKVRKLVIVENFARVDEAHAAVATSVHSELDFTAFFRPVYFRQEIEMTGYRRVTPFADRLGVKIGPLKTIGL